MNATGDFNLSIDKLPRILDGGTWGDGAGHLQGAVTDDENRYLYLSFTDRLIKVDIRAGQIVASVTGLLAGGIFGGGAHLGDLAFYDGKVYGSLEYKAADKFYVAVFDVDNMTKMDMNYKQHSIMSTLYMQQVVSDFTDDLLASEHDNIPSSMGHRYGCSGIDGITFGTLPGDSSGKTYMLLAYGVYGNAERQDNDNQVLLAFDPLKFFPKPFDQDHPHTDATELAAKYFVYTGNTNFGVQNLEFDRTTGDYWMICYKGQKPNFPNYPIYVIDGTVAPTTRLIETGNHPAYTANEGQHLSLKPAGLYHPASGIWGIPLMPENADTGFISLGNDYFYVAQSGRLNDRQFGRMHLCKLNRETALFERVA